MRIKKNESERTKARREARKAEAFQKSEQMENLINALPPGVHLPGTTGTRDGMHLKEDFIKRMKLEVQDAKERVQRTLWVAWHFNTQMMNFIDHPEDFSIQLEMYADQGYIRDEKLSDYDLSHIAAQIGAKSVKRHVNINRSRKIGTGDDLSMDPVALFLGDRMSAYNEFITIEIQVF